MSLVARPYGATSALSHKTDPEYGSR